MRTTVAAVCLLIQALNFDGPKTNDPRLDSAYASVAGQITLTSHTRLSPNANAMGIQGTFLYATIDESLATYDISDNSRPRLVNKISLPGYKVSALLVTTQALILHVALGDRGSMIIMDISKPDRPRFVSSTRDDWPRFVVDNRLVTRSYSPVAFEIWDLSNPAFPNVSKIENWPQEALDFDHATVSEEHLFLLSDFSADAVHGKLCALDISDLKRPLFQACILMPEGQSLLAARGVTAYVLNSTVRGFAGNRLYVIGLTGRNLLELITTIELPADAPAGRSKYLAETMVISGDLLSIADPSFGLAILNLVDPLLPKIVLGYPNDVRGRDVIADAEGQIYVTDGDIGTHSSDVGIRMARLSESGSVEKRGTLTTELPGTPQLLALSEPYLYCVMTDAEERQGVYIADVSDHEDIKFISGIRLVKGEPRSIEIVGSLIYTRVDLMTYVIDSSDIKNPRLLGSFTWPYGINQIDEAGSIAYSILGDREFVVLGLNNVISPTILSRTIFKNPVERIVAHENWVYVAQGWVSGGRRQGLLTLMDLTVPEKPRIVKEIAVDWFVRDVHLAGKYAVLTGDQGLAIDLSNLDLLRKVTVPEFDISLCRSMFDGLFFYRCSPGAGGFDYSVIDFSRPPNTGNVVPLVFQSNESVRSWRANAGNLYVINNRRELIIERRELEGWVAPSPSPTRTQPPMGRVYVPIVEVDRLRHLRNSW